MNFYEEPWRAKRACRGLDPTLWTEDVAPPRGCASTRQPSEREVIAKRICWECCPVRTECLEAGEGHPGIWGGLDEYERSGGPRRRREPKNWPPPPGIKEELTDHTKYILDVRKAQRAAAATLGAKVPSLP